MSFNWHLSKLQSRHLLVIGAGDKRSQAHVTTTAPSLPYDNKALLKQHFVLTLAYCVRVL